jgi:Zn-dependent protease/CBS domain-containing protein
VTEGIRIGRIFGINIAVDPTWVVILVLVVWSLAGGVFPDLYDWTTLAYWVAAIVAALLLFACVLVHEVAHSLVARAQGTPVRGITLFLLGGVSMIEREASSPGREALMAVAGPLASLALGGLFWLAGLAVQLPEQVHAVLVYLGVVNISLAAFNLIPGFPLDGGRLLRALLWRLLHSFRRATRWATWSGIAIGYLMVAIGVYMAYTGSVAGGIWIGFIGWMVVLSARASWRQEEMQARLERIPVTRLMLPPREWVGPLTPLEALTHDSFARSDASCLPVAGESGRFAGAVCRRDLDRSAGPEWDERDASSIMRAAEDLPELPPDASLARALDSMTARDADLLVVRQDASVLGLLDRARVERYARLLAASRSARPRAERAAEPAGSSADAPAAAGGSQPDDGRDRKRAA